MSRSLPRRRRKRELNVSTDIMSNTWYDRGLQPWLGSLWRQSLPWDRTAPAHSLLDPSASSEWLAWLLRLALDGDDLQAVTNQQYLQSAIGNGSNSANPIDDALVVMELPVFQGLQSTLRPDPSAPGPSTPGPSQHYSFSQTAVYSEVQDSDKAYLLVGCLHWDLAAVSSYYNPKVFLHVSHSITRLSKRH
jgi:hypothetical protein